jgi:flagellum-specific peptidoglycan hydrolase FlgJ
VCPVSATVAQYIVETDWGREIIPGTNNPFGVKAVRPQPFVRWPTHEVINGERIPVEQPFRIYSSLAEAFREHALMISISPIYAHVRALLPDLRAYCMALGGSTPERPTWSTDPDYGVTLMEIIEAHNLTQYDGVQT